MRVLLLLSRSQAPRQLAPTSERSKKDKAKGRDNKNLGFLDSPRCLTAAQAESKKLSTLLPKRTTCFFKQQILGGSII